MFSLKQDSEGERGKEETEDHLPRKGEPEHTGAVELERAARRTSLRS